VSELRLPDGRDPWSYDRRRDKADRPPRLQGRRPRPRPVIILGLMMHERPTTGEWPLTRPPEGSPEGWSALGSPQVREGGRPRFAKVELIGGMPIRRSANTPRTASPWGDPGRWSHVDPSRGRFGEPLLSRLTSTASPESPGSGKSDGYIHPGWATYGGYARCRRMLSRRSQGRS